MMNPFAKRKSSASSARNRHMSVLMDPLVPAPPPSSAPPISNSASPNPIQQQQQLSQQYGAPSPYGALLGSSPGARHDPRQSVRYVPTSNPDPDSTTSTSLREIKQEKRPFSPLSTERVASPPQTGKQQGKTQGTSVPNAIPYKPYYPYGTVPSGQIVNTSTTSLHQQPQLSQVVPQGLQPQYQVAIPQPQIQQQALPRTPSINGTGPVAYASIPRAQPPLNSSVPVAHPPYHLLSSALPQQQTDRQERQNSEIVKPIPINPTKEFKKQDEEAPVDEGTSTSGVYALLNHESKTEDHPSKKMRL